MQSWRYESIFAENIPEEDLVANALRTHRRQPSLNPTERADTLHALAQSLQRLQATLASNELEQYWVNQLQNYVHRLQALDVARTPEEQFSQLYYLRKWLFWVPLSLMQRSGGQTSALLTPAHFYATALILEPMFPDLGTSFCSANALPPLENIIRVMDVMYSQGGLTAISVETASLMQFLRQAVFNYRSRMAQTSQQTLHHASPMVTLSETWNHPTIGNLSPAFTPSTPSHYGTPQSASSSQSSWLEVPNAQPGFAYGTHSWGAASPGFPSTTQAANQEMYGYLGMSSMDLGGGFVNAAVWA